MKFLKILIRSLVDFIKDGGFILAGSISYFTMMALVPFCLFLITIFGSLLGQYQGFYEFFSNRIIQFFPSTTSEITEQLGKLIAFQGIGILSIVLYGILSFPLFSSIENALNTIFKVKKKRTFFWSVILSLIIVTLIILIIFISFVGTTVIHFLRILKPTFPELRIGLITMLLIRYVVPFVMILLTTTMIYIIFPKTRVKTVHAFNGALFTTIFTEIAKYVFTWYVVTVVQYGTIYGPLTAFILFLLWVFYSSCIFLIGAEVVHNQSDYKR